MAERSDKKPTMFGIQLSELNNNPVFLARQRIVNAQTSHDDDDDDVDPDSSAKSQGGSVRPSVQVPHKHTVSMCANSNTSSVGDDQSKADTLRPLKTNRIQTTVNSHLVKTSEKRTGPPVPLKSKLSLRAVCKDTSPLDADVAVHVNSSTDQKNPDVVNVLTDADSTVGTSVTVSMPISSCVPTDDTVVDLSSRTTSQEKPQLDDDSRRTIPQAELEPNIQTRTTLRAEVSPFVAISTRECTDAAILGTTKEPSIIETSVKSEKQQTVALIVDESVSAIAPPSLQSHPCDYTSFSVRLNKKSALGSPGNLRRDHAMNAMLNYRALDVLNPPPLSSYALRSRSSDRAKSKSLLQSKVSARHTSDAGHRRKSSVAHLGLNSDSTKPDNLTSREDSAEQTSTPCTPSSVCYWSWRDEQNNWQVYDYELAELIDSFYLVDQRGSLQFRIEQYIYSIDFETMFQTNNLTGKKRPIRRTDIPLAPKKVAVQQSTEGCVAMAKVETPSVVPVTWKCDPKDNSSGFELIEVSKTGDTAVEFAEIAELFERTMLKGTLKSIKRIENHNLYVAFQLYKTQMEKERQQTVDVRRLFHGTKGQYIEVICLRGFDWRVAGSSSGTVYGKGSYFARDARYSKTYADSNKMFLVQVIVGDFTLGRQSYYRPPPRDPAKPTGDLYDSCVDNVENPSIFVTFERWQAYPEYLIEY